MPGCEADFPESPSKPEWADLEDAGRFHLGLNPKGASVPLAFVSMNDGVEEFQESNSSAKI